MRYAEQLKAYSDILCREALKVSSAEWDYPASLNYVLCFKDCTIENAFYSFLLNFKPIDEITNSKDYLIKADIPLTLKVLFTEKIENIPLYINNSNLFVRCAAIFRLNGGP